MAAKSNRNTIMIVSNMTNGRGKAKITLCNQEDRLEGENIKIIISSRKTMADKMLITIGIIIIKRQQKIRTGVITIIIEMIEISETIKAIKMSSLLKKRGKTNQ
jgi:hypothetical protein